LELTAAFGETYLKQGILTNLFWAGESKFARKPNVLERSIFACG